MKTAVIFDMDGVLIDSETFYFQRRMDFFKEKNLTPGSSDLLDYVGKTEQGIWEYLVPGDERLRADLRKEYVEYRKSHPIDFIKALRPAVKPLLEELKKQDVPLALASSSPRHEIERMLEDCQLADYFSYVISGEELHESKPNPEIYLLAMQHVPSDRYIAVEDSVLGIQAAKAAEIYTIALKQAFPIDQSAADLIISDLSEVASVI